MWLLSSYIRERTCANLFVRKRIGSNGVLSDVYVLKSQPDTDKDKSNQTIFFFF